MSSTMPSHLTPRIFRRLLSSRGFTFRCPSQLSHVSRRRPQHAIPTISRSSGRRDIWGFSSRPTRQPRDPELAPGLHKMAELSLMDRMGVRAPLSEDLVEAWKEFFKYQSKRGGVNSFEAKHVLKTFLHLQKQQTDEGKSELTVENLRQARKVMKNLPSDNTDTHLELARLLYKELNGRVPTGAKHRNDLVEYIGVLTLTGHTIEARDLALKELVGQESEEKGALWPWRIVMAGFAREGKETELLEAFHLAEERGLSTGLVLNGIIIKYYADRDNIEATKEWYHKSRAKIRQPYRESHELITAILRFSIRNNEQIWCKTVFRDVLEISPSKKIWDVVLQWAAGQMGKGVEDVERMMKIMETSSTTDYPTIPDIDTINGLVEMSMELKDPYLAERYITLGKKSGIRPNAKTYILQMNYRIEVDDLTGAQAAYASLQAEEITDNEDLPAINEYIRALCCKSSSKYDLVALVISDLEERDARLESQTVSALVTMYLQREELNDALDLLQANAYHYSLAERGMIQQRLAEYCLDQSNSTAKVWDAYTIMRQVFDETDTETRTKIMKGFFRRGRCDMACYTFGHMRQHVNVQRRPVVATYIDCFLGIASLADKESLDMVHNMLKMDSFIEPNTKLYNSLMLAYTACEDSDRALEFWDDITNSHEGPSYKSLEIVFRACQRKPFGDRLAREIWAKMRRMEIEVTQDVFAAYTCALAGQGKLEEAKQLVEEMTSDFGLKPDVMTIGLFYNAIPGQNRKDLVEEWAKDLYPKIWNDLLLFGRTEHEEGHLLFNIKKEVQV